MEHSLEWYQGAVAALEDVEPAGSYLSAEAIARVTKDYRQRLAAAESREAERKAHGECDCGWKSSAAHFSDGMEYYRGIVEQVGEIIGHESHIADDGSDMGLVLCAKVPELVEKMKAKCFQPTTAEVVRVAKEALEEWENENGN